MNNHFTFRCAALAVLIAGTAVEGFAGCPVTTKVRVVRKRTSAFTRGRINPKYVQNHIGILSGSIDTPQQTLQQQYHQESDALQAIHALQLDLLYESNTKNKSVLREKKAAIVRMKKLFRDSALVDQIFPEFVLMESPAQMITAVRRKNAATSRQKSDEKILREIQEGQKKRFSNAWRWKLKSAR